MKTCALFRRTLIFILTFMPLAAMAGDKLTLQVEGVSGDVLKNIETSLTIEKKDLGKQPSTAEIKAFYQRSKKIIDAAISPYGYFNPSIQSRLRQAHGEWIALYKIKLGKPVKVHNIELRVSGPGERDIKIMGFLQHFPLERGDVFTADSYNAAKDRFFEIANNQGYIRARMVESRVLVNTNTRDANIILHMDTGDRYYFGHFSFSDTLYDKDFLQRFDIFRNDEPFSNEELIQYQQDMNDSAYFNNVIVIPDIEKAKNHLVPVAVSVTPPKARSYSFGVGYGTFTGPRLTANVKFKRLTKAGHTFDAKLKLSSVLKGMAGQYTIPGKNPLKETWNINANYQEFRPKNGQSNSSTLAINYLKKIRNWQFSPSINYLMERYSVDYVSNTPTRNSQIFYPALNINYLKTDDVAKPTFGRSFNFTVQGASQDVLSSTSFLQGDIKGKYLVSPFSFSQLLFRANLGYTIVHNLEELPLTMRFFAGGPNSIRGFPDSSIGPGRYLAVGSVEYRNKIYNNFWGAIFYDAGKASNHFGSPLNKGVGLGVIYQSIVGPIKLYFAQAVSKPDKPYQVEFVMGPEF